MAGLSTAARYLPPDPGNLSLAEVRKRARKCQACPLHQLGTQTVFGEGPEHARVAMIGEQPGDQEDTTGRPFVGPAGRLLDEALAAAGIDRDEVYVTNAVKHFKWKPVGKRRLHQKPNAREIAACNPWLQTELKLLQPAVVVALGATAAQALMGASFRVTRDRGRPFDVPWAEVFFATVHPSSILRGPPADRRAGFKLLVADLKKIAAHNAFHGGRNPGSLRRLIRMPTKSQKDILEFPRRCPHARPLRPSPREFETGAKQEVFSRLPSPGQLNQFSRCYRHRVQDKFGSFVFLKISSSSETRRNNRRIPPVTRQAVPGCSAIHTPK